MHFLILLLQQHHHHLSPTQQGGGVSLRWWHNLRPERWKPIKYVCVCDCLVRMRDFVVCIEMKMLVDAPFVGLGMVCYGDFGLFRKDFWGFYPAM
jgi:hypothetical protein